MLVGSTPVVDGEPVDKMLHSKGLPYEFSAEIIALNSNRAYCLKISRQISMKLAIREINLITFLSESKKLRQEKKTSTVLKSAAI